LEQKKNIVGNSKEKDLSQESKDLISDIWFSHKDRDKPKKINDLLNVSWELYSLSTQSQAPSK
jgi:hypothetical protein